MNISTSIGGTFNLGESAQLQEFLNQIKVGDKMYDTKSGLLRTVSSLDRDGEGDITAINWKWGPLTQEEIPK